MRARAPERVGFDAVFERGCAELNAERERRQRRRERERRTRVFALHRQLESLLLSLESNKLSASPPSLPCPRPPRLRPPNLLNSPPQSLRLGLFCHDNLLARHPFLVDEIIARNGSDGCESDAEAVMEVRRWWW